MGLILLISIELWRKLSDNDWRKCRLWRREETEKPSRRKIYTALDPGSRILPERGRKNVNEVYDKANFYDSRPAIAEVGIDVDIKSIREAKESLQPNRNLS